MWEHLRGNKLLILSAIVGTVYFFLKFLAPVISPVFIAMLFVTMFGSTLKKMQARLHINRQIGAVVLLLFAGLFLSILVWILFSWIVGSLPQWLGRLDVLERQITVIVHNGCEIVGNALGIDSSYLENTILSNLADGIDSFQSSTVPGVLSQSLEYVKHLAAFGGFLVTFILSTVLLAKDYDKIMNKLLDREDCHVLLEVICGLIRYIATYVKAQLLMMGAVSVLCALVLSAAGIRHGALWGLLAGLLDALPLFGTSLVLIPTAIAQLMYGYYGKAAVCLLLYGACTLLREVMEPKLISRQMGIPAIAVLLSVYAGIRLFGLWGILKGPLGFMIIYQTYLSLDRRAKL
ncbi:MAG: AI-2E family transporter [Clostridium sp.]|jgi:predicted PurR-regulated permease PerM|nr:AI-2E family transporter [Clostridium sp.]